MFARLAALIGAADTLKGQLIRGGAGSVIAQVAGRIATLALGIVVARSLGTQGYGVYSFAMALLTLLMVLAGLGMPNLLVREVASSEVWQDWPNLRGIIVRSTQLVFIWSAILSTAGTAIVLAGYEVNNASQKYTMLFMLWTLPLAALTNTLIAPLRGLRHVITSQIIELFYRPALLLGVVCVLIIMLPGDPKPEQVMAAQIVVYTAILTITLYFLIKVLPIPVKDCRPTYQTLNWITGALPFTMIAGIGLINNQTDIVMLGMFLPSEEVGIYRVAVHGAVLVAFGLDAINSVITPYFARLYTQGDMKRLQNLVTLSARVILAISLPTALILIFAGKHIITFVFGVNFARAHTPMTVLAIGQLVNATMGSVTSLLNMTGHERYVAKTLVFTAGINIILNIALIPHFGMVGSAVATAISLSLWNIILYVIVKKKRALFLPLSLLKPSKYAMKSPNFFIIGAPKCGTTSMAEWLSDHDQVYMSQQKEPDYFNTDHRNPWRPKNLAEYNELFKHAKSKHLIVGEASVHYLSSEQAVPNILKYCPSAKFLVMLRNPVDLAYSLYDQMLFSQYENITNFSRAWDLQEARAQGKQIPRECKEAKYLQYGEMCRLGSQMKRLYERVSRESVHVVIFDDLKENPKHEYEKVLDFLKLTNDYPADFKIHNKAKERNSVALARMVQWGGAVKRRLNINTRFGILNAIDRNNARNRTRPTLDNDTRLLLSRYFRSDIELLGTILQRDFFHWVKTGQQAGRCLP